jgi:signal transduction histidine kinase
VIQLNLPVYRLDWHNMYIANRLIVPLSLVLLVVGLVALLAVVGMTVWLGDRANEHFDQVVQLRDVRVAAVELRSAVQSAEASQRGLLLTGNEIYLSPYAAAKTSANRQIDSLKRNLGDDPQFGAVLQRLGILVVDKFAEMDKTIELKNDRKDEEALAITNTNRGKALMDEINLFVAGIVRAMDNRLTLGVVQQRANAANLRFASIVASLLIVLVVGAVSATLLRYTRELTQARDEVAALNVSLEGRVKRRTEALARANEEMQRFTHLVSHDIRAPLISIVGFSEEISEGAKDLAQYFEQTIAADDADLQHAKKITNEDMPEAIGYIRKSASKMETLLNAVLLLSRDGRRDPRPESVDLERTIVSSASAIQHQISEADGRIDTKFEVRSIVTDRLSLEQVIGNLFDNAVKYRAKERPLLLKVSSMTLPGDQVAIEVADNGRGIAPQDLGRIFELFRRVGKQDQAGEGVGLAYARTVVRNLGGDVTATSELDKGTTFRIVLPRELALPSLEDGVSA